MKVERRTYESPQKFGTNMEQASSRMVAGATRETADGMAINAVTTAREEFPPWRKRPVRGKESG